MESRARLDQPRPKRLSKTAASAEAARTSTACNACRSRKIKCSGSQPCRFCSRRQQSCVFAEETKGKKRLYPVAYVEDLERQALYRTSRSSPRESADSLPNQERLHARDGQSVVSDAPSDRQSVLIPEPVMTSSLRFGTHLKQLSMDGVPASRHQARPAAENDSPDDAYSLLSQSDKAPVRIDALEWPTEERAQSLLATFLTSIGTVQHLVDPRVFSDSLASTYDLDPSQRPGKSLWVTEFLLVMAIGELLQGTAQQKAVLPGAYYFKEAIARLPGLAALRASGVLAVEIMGLSVFYLQCADCKDDAYVYAGVGLRLAMSSSLARQEGHQRTSWAAHRNRLWWTIYMQERRLAVATGNPVGITDDAISTPMPMNAPGFQPPDALSTNITLARITGAIARDIYSRKHQSERDFVLQTQRILTSLFETQKGMPPDYAVDLSTESCTFSRTAATLYLMLFQAVMLVTRPTLLHAARLKLKQTSYATQTAFAESSLLDKFCRTCIEAARNTLKIMETLRKQGILAIYGFFDLDAIFSAAFVFVMAEIAKTSSTIPEIRSTISLLAHMASCGNKAAENRLADIRQICSRLSISTDLVGSPAIESTDEAAQRDRGSQPLACETQDGQASHQGTWADAPWDGLEGFLNGDLDFSVLESGELVVPPLWQDHEINLDGTMETDWGEFEKLASQFE